MAVKVVTGSDDRVWTVRRQWMFHAPASGEEQEFELDVEGGRIGALIVLVMLVGFIAAVLTTWSADIRMPYYIKGLLLILLLFLPVRWLLRRPWQLVAETPGVPDKYPTAARVGPRETVGNADGEKEDGKGEDVKKDPKKDGKDPKDDPDYRGPDHWVGTVRGVNRSREEAVTTIRCIQTRGKPGYADCPLKRVD